MNHRSLHRKASLVSCKLETQGEAPVVIPVYNGAYLVAPNFCQFAYEAIDNKIDGQLAEGLFEPHGDSNHQTAHCLRVYQGKDTVPVVCH